MLKSKLFTSPAIKAHTFGRSPFGVSVLTLIALSAFAANSILCRLALGEGLIDPASFTSVRLISGVCALMFIHRLVTSSQGSAQQTSLGSWVSGLSLFIYAVAFSYAYRYLDTATGALVLFGAVQITMICWSLVEGHRLSWIEILGVLAALSGFIYLVGPNVTTPSFGGFILMGISGIAWGIYTLKGRGSHNPLGDTLANFRKTVPLVLVLFCLALSQIELGWYGFFLAVISGSLASGLGYAVWYMALGGLSGIQAAVLQLLVPVLAAFGGVFFVGEEIGARLVVASVLVLGGILCVIVGKQVVAVKR